MSSEEQESNPGQQYRSLVEPVWDDIDIYQGPEEFARSFARVPRPAGLLFATHFCQKCTTVDLISSSQTLPACLRWRLSASISSLR
jgi:hypothetical protein